MAGKDTYIIEILKLISSSKRMMDKILCFMPLGMGLIIILIGIIVQINNKKYLETASTTEAVISYIKIDSGIDDDYEVHVAYNVNNVDYDGVLNEYNSGMREGQKITIYYNPQNPSECRGKSTEFSGFLCIGFGVVWIFIFVVVQGHH